MSSGEWRVRQIKPRGPEATYDECGPHTTHASIAQSWADRALGRPRFRAGYVIEVVSPGGRAVRYAAYPVMEVAPVMVDGPLSLQARYNAELKQTAC